MAEMYIGLRTQRYGPVATNLRGGSHGPAFRDPLS